MMQRREALALLTAIPLIVSGNARISTPLPDETIVTPTSVWARLAALRREDKFVPHDYPPLGYAGPDTPEDLKPLTDMVDRAIDGVLALKAETLAASAARPPLREAAGRIGLFTTDDRDRVWGYLVEVWYILGFHVPLFDAIYGEAFTIPERYGEPLPPGWTAPDQPRPLEA